MAGIGEVTCANKLHGRAQGSPPADEAMLLTEIVQMGLVHRGLHLQVALHGSSNDSLALTDWELG